MATSPLEARPWDVPQGAPAQSADAAEPLAGVSSQTLTAATRRVARRWQEEGLDPSDPDVVAGLLAALALAVDQRSPRYVAELLPRPSPLLRRQLVEMLRTELVRGWLEAPVPDPPAAILGTLSALEQVRRAIEADPAQTLAVPLAGSDGLDLLVEVVHDLRSPLTSILFLAETLQRGQSGAVNDLQRRQLGLIYSAALGLSSVVSDAIELARGGDALADPQPSPFSVTELLDSVRSIVHPMAEEKGLAIRLLPPEVDQRVGHAVPLSRVVLNLTTNAIRFTEEGFVEIMCVAKGPTRVEFSVRDSGPGVNPDALAMLFQPFRRAVGRRGYSFSGTGLGLTICRKLVQAMGSELRLETRAQWGTRFFFELDLPPAVSH
jgi:signal transduction histidine kinase